MLDDENVFLQQSPTPASRRSVGRGSRAAGARLNRGGQSGRGGRIRTNVVDAETGALTQTETTRTTTHELGTNEATGICFSSQSHDTES